MSQAVKLVGGGHGVATRAALLPFLDHVHGLDAGDDASGGPERLEPHHRSGSSLDRPVVLLDDVVEVLRLAQFNCHAAVGDQASHSCGVGAALVNRDLFGYVMQVNGTLEESAGRRYIAPSGEQEVHGVPELVDGAV